MTKSTITIGGVEAYDVRTFGAIGDNKANDYYAIQECINAAIRDGIEVVYLPSYEVDYVKD